MSSARTADIVIFGAGIAGLWTHAYLKNLGYDSLLLESSAIGGGQSVASQGIIHSGLKFAFAGKISTLAKSISAMPERWRDALAGQGGIDLSQAKIAAPSQLLMIPPGLLGGISKTVAKKTLGKNVRELATADWPAVIKTSGFGGSVVFMDELVLDIPSVIRALAEPHKDSIRAISEKDSRAPLTFLHENGIAAKKILFTAAGSNAEIAARQNHDTGLETQSRPLLMAMMKPAPFPLYAHFVGKTEKPVATITTHTDQDGTPVWYIGGLVAERAMTASPQDSIDAAKKAFAGYLPSVNIANAQWAVLPISRAEGKSKTGGWMPDTPTLHRAGNALYGWPTKLTFAPMLTDTVLDELKRSNILPSRTATDWSALPAAGYAQTPWDTARWTR